ncbi:MAG: DUF1501 domain-containing protein [Planctomycetaceae bacterium]|nr:DUF1501 domain-containing protein [Planctomycetaceae bacterium]
MPCSAARRFSPLNRREALQAGVGMFGLSLPSYLKAAQESRPGKDISCIFLFLAGGASHYETWDPKPEARDGIRGIWNPISTSVPGTQIIEKMPLLSQLAHKYALIRSWQGKTGSHSGGSQHVMSGVYPAAGRQFYPNFGCVVHALQGVRTPGIAPHVGLPVDARYTRSPAYLGPVYSSFDITGDPSASDFKLDGLQLPRDRFEGRQSLLTQIDNLGRLADQQTAGISAHERFYEEAFVTLTSGRMQRAALVEEEPLALRERYGMNIYGQRVLLARRLVEAGCRFVTINQAVQGGPYNSPNLQTSGTWDNHSDIFSFMMSFAGEPPRGRAAHGNWNGYEGPGNLPQLDISLSALLEDLDQRGLLDTTLVVAMGEFGRTPRINGKGGRDHYAQAGSVLMAGAGIQGGVVVGATDRDGTAPVTRPWTPEDFGATIYHALGIDYANTYYPRQPPPKRIAEGTVIEGLFG